MREPSTGAASAADDRFGDDLAMDQVIGAIEAGRPFSAIKLCHGFWENCVRFQRSIEYLGLSEPLDEVGWKQVFDDHARQVGRWKTLNWPVPLFLDMLGYLSEAHRYPDVLAMVSPYGWAGAYEIEGTPAVGLEATEAAIRRLMSPRVKLYDGLFWKNAVQDGAFTGFVDTLRRRSAVIVGPEAVAGFAGFAGLTDSTFIEVHATRAAWHRERIRDAVGDAVEARGGEGVVCLLEAGGLTSAWLVYELAQRYPGNHFFSVGQVLNLSAPEPLYLCNWFRVHHRGIDATIQAIHPGWFDRLEAHEAPVREVLPQRLWRHAHLNRYEPRLFAMVDEDTAPSGDDATSSIADFIENKPVDEPLVRRLLARSRDANHWANFGPVSRMLEAGVGRLLELPEDRVTVSCKSATDALFALVGAHELEAGRPLNWVVSAFGFFSTRMGPLATARVIDCDERGVLSLGRLRELPLSEWDGIVITNPFALSNGIEALVNFARSHDKRIILDNAAAMLNPLRHGSGDPDEIISFHHTKPWGMGEGGCAIVTAERADTVRALTNFGVGLGDRALPYAMNSKLSDFDAALILQRLVSLPRWRRPYLLQQRRILTIAGSLGLQPLSRMPPEAVVAHVPLLAARPVGREELDNPVLTLRKYYSPLATDQPNAQAIFDRIVCVPCHPGISECDTAAIRDVLSGFAA